MTCEELIGDLKHVKLWYFLTCGGTVFLSGVHPYSTPVYRINIFLFVQRMSNFNAAIEPFGLEKPVVKLQSTYFEKLIF